jgi:hypothetical protein
VLPSKGEIYRSRAPRVHGGYRYVKIQRVHVADMPPHVRAVEVDDAGDGVGTTRKTRDGQTWTIRGGEFTIVLTTDDRGRWRMPTWYEPAPTT